METAPTITAEEFESIKTDSKKQATERAAQASRRWPYVVLAATALIFVGMEFIEDKFTIDIIPGDFITNNGELSGERPIYIPSLLISFLLIGSFIGDRRADRIYKKNDEYITELKKRVAKPENEPAATAQLAI